jgi:flagellar hook-length control protein FliK
VITPSNERIEATSVDSVDTSDAPEERTSALRASSDGSQQVLNAFAQATQPVQTSVAPVATATVDASSGTALARGLAETVHAATLHGDRELRVTLNPPDLGQVTVHITEHDSGGVTVAIQASSHEAHELMQQQLPALRAGLEQRDVRVERLHVEQQASSSGLGWADGGQRQSSGQREAWASREQQQWSPIAAINGTGAVTSRAPRTTRGAAVEDGRVDLRA